MFSSSFTDLLCKLLEKDPSKRLGMGEDGLEEVEAIKQHKFFKKVNWDQVL